jgi:tryptophan synthase beta chain
MVRDFQSVIGREAEGQILDQQGRLPDLLIACVGGGSNSIGLFYEFLKHPQIEMIGVEAGGRGLELGEHAARFQGGKQGVLHGTFSYVLQDEGGQIAKTHSVSAGLDYPSIGPEHALLHDLGRVKYTAVSDQEALEAFDQLNLLEGVMPALESAHAVAQLLRMGENGTLGKLGENPVVIVNISGRGDKDVETVRDLRCQE